jgi:membrane protein
MRRIWELLKLAAAEWNRRDAPRMGASLAFYSLLSLAPLLVIVLGICGFILGLFGVERVESQIMAQFRQMIGDQASGFLVIVMKSAAQRSAGIVANIIGLVTLLVGASGVLIELRTALNQLWGIKPAESSGGLMGLVRDRILSFGMVLGIGFLLLVSLMISAALAVVGKFFGSLAWLPAEVWEVINFAMSVAVISGMFALIFRYVPDARLPWTAIWRGAAATAILFTIGKTGIGIYLGKASVGSAYGAAGSLVVLIVWIYYSAQIFYYGAILTHIYAVGALSSHTETRSPSRTPAQTSYSPKAPASHSPTVPFARS